MILFDKANPLDEIAEIVRLANPNIADQINGSNIVVDKIVAVNPDTNDGYNTNALVRTVGNLNDTVGLIPVRFNRLDLSKYIPWNQVRVPCPSERGRVMPMNLEGVISKGLGTKLESVGRYADYRIYTSGFACAKGQVVEMRLTPLAESLRYTNTQISFKAYGLGASLEHAVNAPAVTPFVDSKGGIVFTGQGKTAYDDYARTPEETKRAHSCTIGMLDFTSVWGEDPSTVIVEHGEEGKLRYKFNAVAFSKINSILGAQGLPPLPNEYFKAYAVHNNKPTGYIYNRSAQPEVTTRSLAISYSNCDWDYFNLANLHDSYDSSYWGRASDWMWFNFQLK